MGVRPNLAPLKFHKRNCDHAAPPPPTEVKTVHGRRTLCSARTIFDKTQLKRFRPVEPNHWPFALSKGIELLKWDWSNHRPMRLGHRWPGDSQPESGPFAQIDLCKSIRMNRFAQIPYFITCERFAQIASNLRFAIFSPRSAIRKKKGSVREP